MFVREGSRMDGAQKTEFKIEMKHFYNIQKGARNNGEIKNEANGAAEM